MKISILTRPEVKRSGRPANPNATPKEAKIKHLLVSPRSKHLTFSKEFREMVSKFSELNSKVALVPVENGVLVVNDYIEELKNQYRTINKNSGQITDFDVEEENGTRMSFITALSENLGVGVYETTSYALDPSFDYKVTLTDSEGFPIEDPNSSETAYLPYYLNYQSTLNTEQTNEVLEALGLESQPVEIFLFSFVEIGTPEKPRVYKSEAQKQAEQQALEQKRAERKAKLQKEAITAQVA